MSGKLLIIGKGLTAEGNSQERKWVIKILNKWNNCLLGQYDYGKQLVYVSPEAKTSVALMSKFFMFKRISHKGSYMDLEVRTCFACKTLLYKNITWILGKKRKLEWGQWR